jgi:hypothetical protein
MDSTASRSRHTTTATPTGSLSDDDDGNSRDDDLSCREYFQWLFPEARQIRGACGKLFRALRDKYSFSAEFSEVFGTDKEHLRELAKSTTKVFMLLRTVVMTV